MKRSSRTKLAILEAARRQFARYGFAKVTMDEIAREIGMGKASLYYYFPTKEQLFMEVISREHAELMENLLPIVRGKAKASDKLMSYADLRFGYFNKLINLNIAEFRHVATTKNIIFQTIKELASQELTVLKKILREGKATGEFRVASIENCAKTIFHILQGMRVLYLQGPQQQSIEQKDFQSFKQEFYLAVEIIVSGIRTPTLQERHNTITNKRTYEKH